ncbi:MAG: lamin tail domain-containing protein [Bacteroidota bacterium]
MRCLAFLLLLPLGLTAQILTDNFADGDLLNPDWQGQTEDFVVEAERLRLMADNAGTSLLYLPARTELSGNTIWEWLAELDFAPSGSNYAEVRLTVDAPQGSAADQGFALRIGGVIGDQDALVFYRLDQGDDNPMITGTAGAVGQNPALARIRLERSPAGLWSLSADYSGGTNFVLEGEATDASFPILAYWAWQCNYTSTRSDAFYLDDLRIEPLVEDLQAPELTQLSVSNATTIELTFNEPLDVAAAEIAANYFIVGSDVPAVISATVPPAEVQKIILELADPLEPFRDYQLDVCCLTDLPGNVFDPQLFAFRYEPTVLPAPGLLLITEIMADPSPQVGQPNTEYIELYNASDLPLQLEGLGVASGGSPQLLPEFLLPVGGYVVVADEDDLADFPAEVPIIGVASFPSLSNGGDEVICTSAGLTVDQVNYTDEWYADPERSGGGYSLERIGLDADQSSDCSGRWRASLAPSGGTPGAANSVNDQTLETEPPRITSAFVDAGDPSIVILQFSEIPLEQGILTDFELSFSPSAPIDFVAIQGAELTIQLDDELDAGILYTLQALLPLQDCLGNENSLQQSFQLAIPQVAAAGEVVINEVLFNPATGGVDFLELFNCSDRIFSVRDWLLLNAASSSSTASQLVGVDRLFFPGEYLVFASDTSDILMRYEQAQVEFLLEQRLPTMPNDSGNISVFNELGEELDAFDYREELHSDLLDEEDGVSLERLNAKATTQLDGNWFSAASSVGFATPTRINSQNRADILPMPEEELFFSLPERTFSPDGDGFQDALRIDYETPNAGWLARVRIYDGQGRLVRVLRRVELLAGQGNLLWDGATDDGLRARTGAYIVLIELFEPDGGTRTERLLAALYNG